MTLKFKTIKFIVDRIQKTSDDLEGFARDFKQRRIKLGYTQVQSDYYRSSSKGKGQNSIIRVAMIDLYRVYGAILSKIQRAIILFTL